MPNIPRRGASTLKLARQFCSCFLVFLVISVTSVSLGQQKLKKNPYEQRYRNPGPEGRKREEAENREIELRRLNALTEKQTLLRQLEVEIRLKNWERGLDLVEDIEDLGNKYNVQSLEIDPGLFLNVAYPGKKFKEIVNYFDKNPQRKTVEFMGEYLYSCTVLNKPKKAKDYVGSVGKILLQGRPLDIRALPLASNADLTTFAFFSIGSFSRRLDNDARLAFLLNANEQKPKSDWILLGIAVHFYKRKMFNESLAFYQRLEKMGTPLAKARAAFGIAGCHQGIAYLEENKRKGL